MKTVLLLVSVAVSIGIGAFSVYAQDDFPPITDENARYLTQLDPIGYGRIEEMRWSPDGRWLAIRTAVGVLLYDDQQPDAEPVFLRVLDKAQAFTFSPESDAIAVAGCSGSVSGFDYGQYDNSTVCASNETHFWRLDDLSAPLYMTSNGQTSITQVYIAPVPMRGLPLVISIHADRDLYVWNGLRQWIIDLPVQQIQQITFSATPPVRIAVLASNPEMTTRPSSLFAFDLEFIVSDRYPHLSSRLWMPESTALYSIAFSEDGQTLVAMSQDGTWQWDLEQPEARPIFEERSYNAAGITRPSPFDYFRVSRLSPGYSYFIIGQRGYTNDYETYIPGILQFYDKSSGNLIAEMTNVGSRVPTAFSPNDAQVAYVDADHNVHIYDLWSRDERVLDGFALETLEVVIAPDGAVTYTSCANFVTGGEVYFCIPASTHVVNGITPSSLPAALDLSSLLPNLSEPEQAELRSTVSSALSADGKLIGTVNYDDGIAHLWDIETSTMRATLFPSPPAPHGDNGILGYGAAFSPDGSLFAFGSCYRGDNVGWETWCDDLRIYLYSVANAIEAGELYPESAYLILADARNDATNLVFSPDGSVIAASSARRDATISVWSARTGELLAVLPAGIAPDIAFSPEGRILYSTSRDGVLYRWAVQADQER